MLWPHVSFLAYVGETALHDFVSKSSKFFKKNSPRYASHFSLSQVSKSTMIETNRLVSFALWCVLLHLSQVPVSSSNTPRIVGGEEASPGAYPFFALFSQKLRTEESRVGVC
jgi:hypothetical protein